MATTCPTQLPSGRHEASGRSTKVPAIPLPDDESSAFTEFPVLLKIARLVTFRRKIENIMLAVGIAAFAENCKLGRI